jgi:hypothetical protein
MLPPGRDMLATSPLFTGSATRVITIGIAAVAFLAARAAEVFTARMTSTMSRYEFICQSGESLVLPSRMPRLNRDVFALNVTKLAESLLNASNSPGGGESGDKTPIRYTFSVCCAPAAPGTAKAPAARSAGNSGGPLLLRKSAIA